MNEIHHLNFLGHHKIYIPGFEIDIFSIVIKLLKVLIIFIHLFSCILTVNYGNE